MNNIERIFSESSNSATDFINGYVDYLCKLLKELDTEKVALCIDQLEEARQNDNTVFIIGNGGSASTSSHIGNDFGLAVLKFAKDKTKSYRVLSLAENMSVVTAIGNDSAYENIFVDQLKVHFRPGDKLLAISCSGNSPNLVKAAEWFKEQGGTVMSWLGFDGGKLLGLSDVPVVVTSPKGEYAPVEDVHLVINHIIVSWLQQKLIHNQ